MSERYNVVLEGKTRPEASREAVVPDLAALVGRDADFARELLSGRPVVLRAGIPRAEADDALAALTRIGALAFVERAPDVQIDADVAARLQRRSRPGLWNPNAAACWCVLFTPVFGSALVLLNWRSMQAQERVGPARAWMFASVAMFMAVLVGSIVVPAASNGLRLASFVYLLVWYFASARPQVAFVRREYGTEYPRRAWWKPLLIAVVASIVAMFVASFLAAWFGSTTTDGTGTTVL